MINGILNIYKEKGYTSHDVVARLRGIVGQKKIGHTGTLDPDAEGVLPVCLGRATKVCDLLTDRDKTYETVLLLGKTTDTQDILGTVLEEHHAEHLTEKEVSECIQSYIGEYDQIPPMYSALKVGGKKLYELAREGKTVERKSRKVMIHNIYIKEILLPRVKIEVSCSKGTYIRTLCHDIGESLGVGGCMESLLRTRVGRFLLEDSLRLSEVESKMKEGTLSDILIPLDTVFSDLRAAILKEKYVWPVYNGNPFQTKHIAEAGLKPADGEEFRVYDAQGRFIGVYSYECGRGQFRIKKMFLNQEELKEERG